jgi:hypothetical protein
MRHATVIPVIRSKYETLAPLFDEHQRRLWAASEARVLGYGGISAVARATGLDRDTIAAGLQELGQPSALHRTTRIRRPGAGRKSCAENDPQLLVALDQLIDPYTRGDPQSPLRWTCKSTRNLANELTRQGHPVSPRTVAVLLREAGYSLQANRKTHEGCSEHPDRDKQFRHINHQVALWQREQQPAISVDCKKKENLGDFKNAGRAWHPAGHPPEVRSHDFKDKQLGKAIPHGVYDLANNEGWVTVGVDHDTAEFAVASISRWWQRMGCKRFPQAQRLLITADGGGSNAIRCRLWKISVQELANRLGMPVSVCHFPPGTSKWNKIEHRLFCQITQNWRGRPLLSREVIVELIRHTRTATGLLVEAELDTALYPLGKKVSVEELARVHLKPAQMHGEWNYTISPDQ